MPERAAEPPAAAARGARQRALDYLAAHNVTTLATAGPEGPWAAAVFYASDGFRLTFLSAASTRHARQLAADPRVAATVQEDYRDWPSIRGVQLEGTARLLEGEAREAARARYAAKFPIVGPAALEPIARALLRVSWYELLPTRVYFIDNSRGLGHRDEVFP